MEVKLGPKEGQIGQESGKYVVLFKTYWYLIFKSSGFFPLGATLDQNNMTSVCDLYECTRQVSNIHSMYVYYTMNQRTEKFTVKYKWTFYWSAADWTVNTTLSYIKKDGIASRK